MFFGNGRIVFTPETMTVVVTAHKGLFDRVDIFSQNGSNKKMKKNLRKIIF